MKSLSDLMAVYAAHHRHPVNKLLHAVGVPAIAWSVMLALSLGPTWSAGGMEFGLAHVATAVLLAYYLMLDFALGVAAVAAFTVLLVGAIRAAALDSTAAWTLAGAAFVAGWALQLLGHGVWERRRPAFMEGLAQVFVAPVFLVAEAAFALGLRRTLREDVQRKMGAHLPG